MTVGNLTMLSGGVSSIAKIIVNGESPLELVSSEIQANNLDGDKVFSIDTENLQTVTKCSVVSEKKILQTYSVVTYVSDTSNLYTPADILGGIIYRSTTDQNIIDQVPTATDMYNYIAEQCGAVYVGTGIKFSVINSGLNSFILMGNVGVPDMSNNFIDVGTGQTFVYLFNGVNSAELYNLSFYEPIN